MLAAMSAFALTCCANTASLGTSNHFSMSARCCRRRRLRWAPSICGGSVPALWDRFTGNSMTAGQSPRGRALITTATGRRSNITRGDSTMICWCRRGKTMTPSPCMWSRTDCNRQRRSCASVCSTSRGRRYLRKPRRSRCRSFRARSMPHSRGRNC